MKSLLEKRFESTVANLANAKALLAGDNIDAFSEAIDSGLEGLTRVQDDFAIYGELHKLRTENAELREKNEVLRTENEKFRTESE